MPFSPSVTLQWTQRDGLLVNLPWALLVKGDIVHLKPGQTSPCHVSRLNVRILLYDCAHKRGFCVNITNFKPVKFILLTLIFNFYPTNVSLSFNYLLKEICFLTEKGKMGTSRIIQVGNF